MARKITLIILCILLCLSNGCKETDIEGNLIDEDNNKVSIYHDVSEAKVLRIVDQSGIYLLDPSITIARRDFEVLGNTMEGLFVLTGGNKLKKGVCESYTVSEDGKTYTFKLRKDSVWSNGESFTANDFVYAWRRVVTPGTRAQTDYQFEIAKIKNSSAIMSGDKPVEELGVIAKDDYTLVVELENPVPYLPEVLSHPKFLPLNKTFVEEKGELFGTSVENTLFNGPYLLDSWEIRKQFIYKKNQSYWNKDSINIDEIDVIIANDESDALDMYLSDEIDYLHLTKKQFLEYYNFDNLALESNFSLEDLITIPSSVIYYLELNHNNEIMNNINFRKALALSIDKSFLTDQLSNYSGIPADYIVPSNFVIGPDGKDFREETNGYNQYSIEESQKYWEKAKEELGIIEATIVLGEYNLPIFKKVVYLIKGQLESNLEGLSVEVKTINSFSSSSIVRWDGSEDMIISLCGPNYLDPLSFLELWTTEYMSKFLGFSNGYSNSEYDSIIERTSIGDLARNPEARWYELQRVERILLNEDAAIIPLYQKETMALLRDNVKNWNVNTLPPYRYWGTLDIEE